jgi:predicted metalloprotease
VVRKAATDTDESVGAKTETRDLAKTLAFARAELHLPKRFRIPDEAVIPLMLSLRSGGDWCYASERVRAVSVLKKTTVYDEARKAGYTLEEIYLFVNPRVTAREGQVRRLEKCGEEATRLLVVRPYRITLAADRILAMTVNPEAEVVKTEELPEKEMRFEGSTAFNAAHELEHLEQRHVTGRQLWELRFREG